MDVTSSGPDLAIVGAARSGTSLLAAHLSTHPCIDASAVKEPNYFSRHFDRGQAWYEGYFRPREAGLLRLDASVSHTFPQFPEALQRLADASPSAYVVYVVRDPVPRAVSHFHYYRFYFANEDAVDFGTALRRDDYYVGVSDYRRWLTLIEEVFPREQVLVVPFPAVTASSAAVAAVVCEQLGIEPPPEPVADEVVAHRNNVVTFRNEAARRATRTLRRSRFYPVVRRALGAGTLRSIRALVTAEPAMPTLEETLDSCSDDQRALLDELERSGRDAVAEWLSEQDTRLGLAWTDDWVSALRKS